MGEIEQLKPLGDESRRGFNAMLRSCTVFFFFFFLRKKEPAGNLQERNDRT